MENFHASNKYLSLQDCFSFHHLILSWHFNQTQIIFLLILPKLIISIANIILYKVLGFIKLITLTTSCSPQCTSDSNSFAATARLLMLQQIDFMGKVAESTTPEPSQISLSISRDLMKTMRYWKSFTVEIASFPVHLSQLQQLTKTASSRISLVKHHLTNP